MSYALTSLSIDAPKNGTTNAGRPVVLGDFTVARHRHHRRLVGRSPGNLLELGGPTPLPQLVDSTWGAVIPRSFLIALGHAGLPQQNDTITWGVEWQRNTSGAWTGSAPLFQLPILNPRGFPRSV